MVAKKPFFKNNFEDLNVIYVRSCGREKIVIDAQNTEHTGRRLFLLGIISI